MGFFVLSVMGMGAMLFVVIAYIIIKFGTGIKLDVFYTMAAKKFVTSQQLRNNDATTCILADM